MKKFQFRLCVLLAVVAIVISSCKPFQEQKYVEIKPNETAIVIPLEENTKQNQKQLKSLEYLEQHKVADKRVFIPTTWHQTGRMGSDGQWIPTVKVIVVDRAPITREWTKEASSGTSTKNEGIVVESRNSIAFLLGITCTASIPEEDATKFLYWYGGKSLAEVMDQTIRAYVLDYLSGQFGQRELTACQNERTDVFNGLKKQTKEWFAQFGIRIDNIGCAGDFKYLDTEIQTAINLQFTAEKKNAAATQEVAAAKKYAEAAEAIKGQKRLDAEINLTNALAEAIRGGKLTWPQTLVVGKDMSMMDLYGTKKINSK